MKSLINLLGRSTLGIKVRNFIGYRPVILNNDYKDAYDVISFNPAISACSIGGQWQHVLLLLGDTCQAAVTLDVVSFTAVIFAFGEGGP